MWDTGKLELVGMEFRVSSFAAAPGHSVGWYGMGCNVGPWEGEETEVVSTGAVSTGAS